MAEAPGSLSTQVVNLGGGSGGMHCLLLDLHPGPRILIDCPLSPSSFANIPVHMHGRSPDDLGGAERGRDKGGGGGGAGGAAGGGVGGGGFAAIKTAELAMVDPATVDCVLLTNFNNALGLPCITECSPPGGGGGGRRSDDNNDEDVGEAGGFEGMALATEPTAQLGKLLIDELISFASASSNGAGQSCLPYTKEEAERSMARINRLSYGQTRDIGGGWTAAPQASGHCLGASNWLITSATHRIAIIGASSMSPHVRHPSPLNFSALQHCDLAIIGDLLPRERDTQGDAPASAAPNGTGAPNGGAYPLSDVCTGVSQTLLRGGNILLPTTPCGTAIDLVHAIGLHLAGAGLMHSPMYLISPVGLGVLGYLEILAEWVHTSRRDRVYLPESPFLHNDMIASNRLHVVSEVWALSGRNYTEPCVVLAGHPSLRFGPVLHFLRLWAQNTDDAVILTDATWNSQRGDLGAALLKPHQPLSLKKMCAPLDTRITRTQATRLLSNLAPTAAIVQGGGSPLGDAVVQLGGHLQTATVVSPTKATPAMMDVELASSLGLHQISGVPATALSCRLSERDGTLTLDKISGDDGGGARGEHHVVFGHVQVPTLVTALRRRGIDDAEIIQKEGGGGGARKGGGGCTVRSMLARAEVVIGDGTCKVVTGIDPSVWGVKAEDEEGGLRGDDADVAAKARGVTEAVLEQIVRL